MSPRRFAASGIFALALAGCGGGGSDSDTGAAAPATSARATASQPAKPKPSGETVKTDYNNDYGRLLVDDRGRTLYLFTKESGAKSECYGACAAAWPPYLTKGEPAAGDGVTQGKLGTTKRTDGATQVTYDGHPLYFYVGEKAAGQVLCQDEVEFGGTWLIVAPDGKPIQ